MILSVNKIKCGVPSRIKETLGRCVSAWGGGTTFVWDIQFDL